MAYNLKKEYEKEVVMRSSSEHFQSMFRFLVNVVLIVLQLTIIGLIILEFSEDAVYGYCLFEGLAIFVVLNIVYRKKTAAYKISWIIFVLVVPVVGICFILSGDGSGCPGNQKNDGMKSTCAPF